MLERRSKARRRVCLTAEVTGNQHSAPERSRLRSVSDGGVELVSPKSSLPSDEVMIAIDRDEGTLREAKVVWRRFDRFGLAFQPGSRLSDDPRPGPLSKLVRRNGGTD